LKKRAGGEGMYLLCYLGSKTQKENMGANEDIRLPSGRTYYKNKYENLLSMLNVSFVGYAQTH